MAVTLTASRSEYDEAKGDSPASARSQFIDLHTDVSNIISGRGVANGFAKLETGPIIDKDELPNSTPRCYDATVNGNELTVNTGIGVTASSSDKTIVTFYLPTDKSGAVYLTVDGLRLPIRSALNLGTAGGGLCDGELRGGSFYMVVKSDISLPPYTHWHLINPGKAKLRGGTFGLSENKTISAYQVWNWTPISDPLKLLVNGESHNFSIGVGRHYLARFTGTLGFTDTNIEKIFASVLSGSQGWYEQAGTGADGVKMININTPWLPFGNNPNAYAIINCSFAGTTSVTLDKTTTKLTIEVL